MSKVVYSPEGYNIGSAHYVEKDKEYEIVDTLSGNRSALKGSSLIARINKETKFKNYTLSNVQYGCKPPIYMSNCCTHGSSCNRSLLHCPAGNSG